MARVTVILVRVILAFGLFLVGLAAGGQGLFQIGNAAFPNWRLMLGMFTGMAIGASLVFVSWRLLTTTLRLAKESPSDPYVSGAERS